MINIYTHISTLSHDQNPYRNLFTSYYLQINFIIKVKVIKIFWSKGIVSISLIVL